MDFEVKIKDGLTTIFCDNKLYEFASDFIEYYNKDIIRIKKELGLIKKYKIIFALFSTRDVFDNIPYKDKLTSFSGFFTDTGVAAYVQENGNYTRKELFQRLMHECVHYLYKNYVYGNDKERITWVDEGLACFLSDQNDYLKNNEKYLEFVRDNICAVNLNELNHDDESFGNKNGYNLSYIAIRYLYENNTHNEFLQLIKDRNKLTNIGSTVLKQIMAENRLERDNRTL